VTAKAYKSKLECVVAKDELISADAVIYMALTLSYNSELGFCSHSE
jgi:hypothetical protein